MIEFKVVLFKISKYMYLNNKGWIRIRMDPELLSGSGSGINHSGSTTLLIELLFFNVFAYV